MSIFDNLETYELSDPDAARNHCAADMVSHPSHYTSFPVEVINIIRMALGPDGFKAYCFGNEIKYRMRAGIKTDNADMDIQKAMMYKKFREEV